MKTKNNEHTQHKHRQQNTYHTTKNNTQITRNKHKPPYSSQTQTHAKHKQHNNTKQKHKHKPTPNAYKLKTQYKTQTTHKTKHT